MLNDEKSNQRSNSKTVRFTNNNINKKNDVKNIDFFERPDRNVEKKAFPDAYK